MSHATSGMPAPIVLDWRRGTIGPPEHCVLCQTPTVCRSPVTGVPCHKACAETWIITHAATAADRARLIRACTPGRGEPR
jgi:hypothetical protein